MKEKRIIWQFLFTLFLSSTAVICLSSKKLAFNETGDFTILQITDFHCGETELKDLFTVSLINFLLGSLKPDLTMLTGDMVSGYMWDGTSTFYQRQWNKYTSPFLLHQAEYAITLGNHDAQANLNRSQIIDLDMTHPYSQTRQTPEGHSEGSNYYLPIYESATSDKVKAILWVVDSQEDNCLGMPDSYGCILPDIVKWVEETIVILDSKYPNLLHIAFFHIPLPEYVDLYNNHEVYGFKMEAIECPLVNTNFYKVMKEHNIQAGFCGHDHNNDFGGYYSDVELVYGRKSGFGGYGPPLGKKRGGRGIYLKLDEHGQAVYSHDIIQYDGLHLQNGEATKRNDFKQSQRRLEQEREERRNVQRF